MENVLLTTLKAKLTPSPAPPGLASRIRAALRQQAAPHPGVPWYRAPWLAATAAAALLMVLLVPSLTGELDAPAVGSTRAVHEEIVVVDRDCDRAGHGLDKQRRCSHPLHINALKRADGSYWTISPDQIDYRYLLLERAVRGRRMIIDGEAYPAAKIIRLNGIEQLDSELMPDDPATHAEPEIDDTSSDGRGSLS